MFSVRCIGQDAPSLEQVSGNWHGIRPWGVLPVLWGCDSDCSFKLLLLLGIVTGGAGALSLYWNLLVGLGIPLNLPWAKLYAVTGMDVAVTTADFAFGIWIVTIEVTNVGVGSAGRVVFMGKVGLAGIGWVITLILNLPFTDALVLFFFSAFLGARVFQGKEFWFGKKMLMCDGLPSLPSSSKYVFIFLIRDGKGSILVLQGLQDITWVVHSLLNVWIPLIILFLLQCLQFLSAEGT